MKIAIVRLSALGDIVQSQIVLQFIKKKFPHCEIHWFCDEGFKEILEENIFVDKVIALGLKDLKHHFSFQKLFTIIKELKTYKKYDYIIDLQGLIKSALVSRLLGKNTYGFNKDSIREGFATKFYRYKFSVFYTENVIRRYTKLIGKIFDISISDEDIICKEKILYFKKEEHLLTLKEDKKSVLFVLGASWESKIYPVEKLANVANELDVTPVVVWGDKKEELLADEFVKLSPKAIKCKKLSINALMCLIDQVDLVIGGDTGPTHMAWALNKAVITIFGVTPSFRNAFVSPLSRVVDTGKKIDPLHLNRDDFNIRSIPEHKIITIAKGLLGR